MSLHNNSDNYNPSSIFGENTHNKSHEFDKNTHQSNAAVEAFTNPLSRDVSVVDTNLSQYEIADYHDEQDFFDIEEQNIQKIKDNLSDIMQYMSHISINSSRSPASSDSAKSVEFQGYGTPFQNSVVWHGGDEPDYCGTSLIEDNISISDSMIRTTQNIFQKQKESDNRPLEENFDDIEFVISNRSSFEHNETGQSK